MEIIRLNPECISCLVKKQIERFPENASMHDKIEYMQSVLRTVADAPMNMGAPEIVDKIYDIQKNMFGAERDYSDIKRYFNNLMLDIEHTIENKIKQSFEPLKLAVQYIMTGNYIDFAAMDKVDENKLQELLESVDNTDVNEQELEHLEKDLLNSEKLVYLTDNCGEIVLDKLFISVIKMLNSSLNITVIVRGMPVVNDVTIEDAEQVGLTNIVKVIGSGSSVAGTCLNKISDEARCAIENADVIISKGQGNFETLQKCGMNVYYIFMCKCKMFADRFGVPLYSGMLINDKTVRKIL